MRLYSYWRSTTSYRVRIALNLKGVAYQTLPVDLLAGQQRRPDYATLNPAMGVPSLVTPTGQVLTQSMAILDWLEETRPDPALLPADPLARAQVRAAALVIATDVHPVNNLRVIARLRGLGLSQKQTADWMQHWMREGLTAFAALLPDSGPDHGGPFCFGKTPGLADICLVPQLYNARRWGMDLTGLHRLTAIETNCLALAAFDAARPEAQPDAK